MLHEYLPIYMKLCRKPCSRGTRISIPLRCCKMVQELIAYITGAMCPKFFLPSRHAQRGATHQTHAGSPSG